MKNTIHQLKEEQEQQYIKYKYVELKQRFRHVRDYYGHQGILNNMWETGPLDCSSFIAFPIADDSNALTILLSLCGVQWACQETVNPISVYPYSWCCDCDVDIGHLPRRRRKQPQVVCWKKILHGRLGGGAKKCLLRDLRHSQLDHCHLGQNKQARLLSVE